jgi:TolB-like protein
MKTQIKESSKLLATIGAGGGFIADVLTPLGPVTKWLFFGLLIISFILLIFFFLNRKSEHSKIKKFLPVSAILTVIFGIFFFLNSNTEKGFLGDNTEVVSNLQNSLFNIEKSIDEINEKQTDILDNIQDIKDIVSGDSELKNMSNSEDLTIVKDLNKRTKHKNAKRIAIVYFDNTSGEKTLDKLKKGLAGMLITDLSNINMLDIIERERLEEIIKEQKLSKSKGFDISTAAKVGKLLGAEIILTGAYFEMFGAFRIDARFIDVKTGQILKSEGVEGATTNFFKLEKQLAWKIIKNLDIKLSDIEENYLNKAEKEEVISYTATLMFSDALELIDNSETESAIKKLNLILDEFPHFTPAKQELKKLKFDS